MIKKRITICAVALLLAGCGARSLLDKPAETTPDGTSTADSISEYQLALANRIAQVNSTKVFIGRPQALLRSVVVVKYVVDANGSLLRLSLIHI